MDTNEHGGKGLKARKTVAQGNALGKMSPKNISPEGRQKTKPQLAAPNLTRGRILDSVFTIILERNPLA
jgi:hypothetical protein